MICIHHVEIIKLHHLPFSFTVFTLLVPYRNFYKGFPSLGLHWLYVHFTQNIVLTNLSNSMIIYLKIGGSDES